MAYAIPLFEEANNSSNFYKQSWTIHVIYLHLLLNFFTIQPVMNLYDLLMGHLLCLLSTKINCTIRKFS